MPQPTNGRQGDPFALDADEFPFAESLVVQVIASPAHLHWDEGGGGFFVESDEPPLEHFLEATLVTGAGKRVPGYAARTLLLFPVAARTRWELGEPGSRVPVSGYQEGARSRTTLLGILETGQWLKLAVGGLVSQSLANAFRDHRFRAAGDLQRQPFAVAFAGLAGEAVRVKDTLVTPFQFVTLPETPCPEALGWTIRERWDEVLAWRGSKPAPTPSPTPANGTGRADRLVYGSGEKAADNPVDQDAFRAFSRATGASPGDRDALRFWYLEQAGGEEPNTQLQPRQECGDCHWSS